MTRVDSFIHLDTIALWPLFNYLLWSDATDGRIERKQWDIYKSVNQKYADMVLEHYTEDDTGNKQISIQPHINSSFQLF